MKTQDLKVSVMRLKKNLNRYLRSVIWVLRCLLFKSSKSKTTYKKDFDENFAKVDAILTPSTPSSAFKIGEKTNDPISMYLNDIFTVPVNLAGLPAISVPAGLDKKGYPLGLQLIGKTLDEQNILNIAYAFEKNCNFNNEIKKWWL